MKFFDESEVERILSPMSYMLEPNQRNDVDGNTIQKYYHYTSLSSCISMINDNKGTYTMWASNLAYLNDKREYLDGYELVINQLFESHALRNNAVLKEKLLIYFPNKTYEEEQGLFFLNHPMSKIYPDVYILCFCRNGNLLSQWKYYGKESGIAIEYTLENCEFSGDTINAVDALPYKRHLPCNVYYDSNKKKELISAVIQNAVAAFTENMGAVDSIAYEAACQLNFLIPYFKDSSFSEELETRLTFMPQHSIEVSQEAPNKLIKYRERDGIIIPYLNINMRSIDKKPIVKSLSVGPGRNQELIFQALIHFFDTRFCVTEHHSLIPDKDYSFVIVNGIEIRKLNIPFRG